jgi:hypothetical protein
LARRAEVLATLGYGAIPFGSRIAVAYLAGWRASRLPSPELLPKAENDDVSNLLRFLCHQDLGGQFADENLNHGGREEHGEKHMTEKYKIDGAHHCPTDILVCLRTLTATREALLQNVAGQLEIQSAKLSELRCGIHGHYDLLVAPDGKIAGFVISPIASFASVLKECQSLKPVEEDTFGLSFQSDLRGASVEVEQGFCGIVYIDGAPYLRLVDMGNSFNRGLSFALPSRLFFIGCDSLIASQEHFRIRPDYRT